MNQPNTIAINGPLADRLALDIQAALCGKYTTTFNNETLGPTYPQGEVIISIVDLAAFANMFTVNAP